jgi:hypothetical protein
VSIAADVNNNMIDATFIGNAIFSASNHPIAKAGNVVINSRTCNNNITIN